MPGRRLVRLCDGVFVVITYRLFLRANVARRRFCGLYQVVCPVPLVPSYSPTSEKSLALIAMVKTLLQKDVIKEVPPTQLCLFHIVFSRQKPNGYWSLILDVARLDDILVVNLR